MSSQKITNYQKIIAICTIFLCTSSYAESSLQPFSPTLKVSFDEKDNQSKNLSSKAKLYIETGHYRKAKKSIIKAIEIDQQIYQKNHKKTATDFFLLATCLSLLGEYTNAKAYYIKSQEIQKQLYKPDHSIFTNNLYGLAVLIKMQGKYEKSLSDQKIILKTRQNAKPKNNADIVKSLLEITDLQIILAYYNSAKKTLDLAKHSLDKGFNNSLDKNLDKNNSVYFSILRLESQLAMIEGDYVTAKQHDKILLDTQVKLFGRKNILVADTLSNIAKHLMLDRKWALAIPILNESVAIYDAEMGSRNFKTGANLSYIATADREIGNTLRAQEINRRSTDILKVLNVGKEHPLVAFNLINDAKSLATSQKYEIAHQKFLEAQAMLETAYRGNHPTVALVIADRANLFVKQKKYTEAKNQYIKAIDILHSYFSASHPLVLSVSQQYDALIKRN